MDTDIFPFANLGQFPASDKGPDFGVYRLGGKPRTSGHEVTGAEDSITLKQCLNSNMISAVSHIFRKDTIKRQKFNKNCRFIEKKLLAHVEGDA
jgi:hypothetical protein